MHKSLLVLIFLVGFFGGLALGLLWAQSEGIQQILLRLDTLKIESE